jgi:hypothetical protein
MDLCCWFPCVVTVGVPFPLDEILQGSGSSMTLVADDALNLILFFSINQIWRWA